jgi:hypothetical protein
MAELKYAQNIVTKPLSEEDAKKRGLVASDNRPGHGGRVLWIDSDFVKGAFYTEVVHIAAGPRPENNVGIKPHIHNYDEILGFVGTDTADKFDLGGEIEFWLDDEKYILTKSCLVFVPKGLRHCPLRFLRVDKPIVHFTITNGSVYEQAKKFEV